MPNKETKIKKSLITFSTLENFIGFELVEKNTIMVFFRKKVVDPNLKLYTESFSGSKTHIDLGKQLEWVGECPYYLQRCFVEFDKTVNKLTIEYTSKNNKKRSKSLYLSRDVS